jgi:predicted N-acetyltransferase YhbS
MAVLAPADGPVLEQILDATYGIWHEGLSRRAYAQFYAAQRATPWGRAHLERLALVEGRDVIVSAKMYRFDATLDGRAVRVAGLGAIFTQPAHRGRGAARELVERLLERATAAGADLALLFSEIGADYYARLGFKPIATTLHTLRVLEDDRRGAPAIMVRAGEERDLNDLVSIGSAMADPYRFRLRRDRDQIQFALARKRLLAGLSPPGARELMFFVAEEGASAVGYVVISVSGRQWVLEECGDRDPAGARVGAILQVLVARDPAETRPAFAGWLPAGFRPPQLHLTASGPAAEVMMMRQLTTDGAARLPLAEHDTFFWHSDVF